MKFVYKYFFYLKNTKFSLSLPVGWKFLYLRPEDEKIFIWTEVREGAPTETAHFQVFGTGQEIPLSAEYLTSYSVGPFNFHLYLMHSVT